MNRFIEFRANPEIYFDAKTLDTTSLRMYKEIASLLQKNHLSVTFHGPFIDMSAGSTDDRIRETVRFRFKQVLELIDIFHPKSIVFHVGYEQKRYGFIKKDWIQNSIRTWSWLAQEIQVAGSRLMLENVFENYPDDLEFLCDTLNKYNAGFCLDVGHLTVFSQASTEQWLNGIGHLIGQFHLHDNHGVDDDHLGLGLGSINFTPVFDFIQSRKDKPLIITLEPHDETQLMPSLEYLEKCISG